MTSRWNPATAPSANAPTRLITAALEGFTAPKVRFFAKYASASQWEQAEMRAEPGGSAYQFLIAGVPESLDYYVEAGGVRSQKYKLNVVDLPSVKNIRVTYRYPAWTGMKNFVEDPGGDLRAVEGTTAEVAIQTDRPLANGTLLLDDGTKLLCATGATAGWSPACPSRRTACITSPRIESGEDVRLSEDYFIEAQKDNPPEIEITRPGRDFRAIPIEEVTVAVEAKDDFGLRRGPALFGERRRRENRLPAVSKASRPPPAAPPSRSRISRSSPATWSASTPPPRTPRQTTNTDMFFIEAQPFERNYTQSQQKAAAAEAGGGDQGEQQNQISQAAEGDHHRHLESAQGQRRQGNDAENGAFLAQVQSKLRDQAKSLADRMKARADRRGRRFLQERFRRPWKRPWSPWDRPPTS